MGIHEESTIPWARLEKPLSESKIALVTTGGVYLDGQTPFSEEDDFTYRTIPRDTASERFRIWHPGYDHRAAEKDINCILPLSRFRELASEGLIGALAESSYSFMGLIYDTGPLINESAPEVARKLKDEGVDAVFGAST